MKKMFIFVGLTIFFLIFSVYVINNYSPLNLDRLQNDADSKGLQRGDREKFDQIVDELISSQLIFSYLTEIAYIAFLLLLAGIWSFFVFLHLLIDKLFFKLFYEEPSYAIAYRRGFYPVVLCFTFVAFKLYNIDFKLLLIVVLILLIFEYLLTPTKSAEVNKEIIEASQSGQKEDIKEGNLEGELLSETKNTSQDNWEE